MKEDHQDRASDDDRELEVNLNIVQCLTCVLGRVIGNPERNTLRGTSLHPFNSGAGTVGDLDAIAVRLLGNRDPDRFLAIEALQSGLFRVGIHHVGDVLDVDRGHHGTTGSTTASLHNDVLQVGNTLGECSEPYVRLRIPYPQGSGWCVDVLATERGHHLLQADIERLKAHRVNPDLDFTLAPTRNAHVGNTVDLEKLGLDLLNAKVVQLSGGETSASRHHDIHDREGSEVGFDDRGRGCIGRQLIANGREALFDVNCCLVEVGVLGEVDVEPRRPERRRGTNRIHASETCDRLFKRDGDQRFDVTR